MAEKNSKPDYRKSVWTALALKREPFDLNGTRVFVRELSGIEFAEYRKKAEAETDETVLAAWVVARCVVDENGKQIFSDEDLEELQRSSPTALLELSMKSLEVSGFTEEQIAEATEDFKKGQGNASSSD